MCIAQDRRKDGKAGAKDASSTLTTHHSTKTTPLKNLLVGVGKRKNTEETCDNTLATLSAAEHDSDRSLSPYVPDDFSLFAAAAVAGGNQETSDNASIPISFIRSFEKDLSFQQIPTGGIIAFPRYSENHQKQDVEEREGPLPLKQIKTSASKDRVHVSFRLSNTHSFAAEHQLHVDCGTMATLGYETPFQEPLPHIPPTPPAPRHEYQRFVEDEFWPEYLMVPSFRAEAQQTSSPRLSAWV